MFIFDYVFAALFVWLDEFCFHALLTRRDISAFVFASQSKNFVLFLDIRVCHHDFLDLLLYPPQAYTCTTWAARCTPSV